MTSKFRTTVRRMLTTSPTTAGVHFHIHRDGVPYVCDFARCESPGLSEHEVNERLQR
jgi:hypothetical protein